MKIAFRIVHGKSSNVGTNYHDVNAEYSGLGGDGISIRVTKLNKSGNWIKSWGRTRRSPAQFSTPHSIAVDAKNHVYVADRGNR